MKQIKNGIAESKNSLVKYKNAPTFAAAGQATQMIIGATEDTDYQIITLASALYQRYELKRVFYSAYIPVADSSLLPAVTTPPPLLREHRLYQADFLMRQYEFKSDEILSEKTPNFNPFLDPKCNWAVNNMHYFPVDVNKATLQELLRVPGIGPTSARRIVKARREGKLGLDELKRMGAVLKRAKYFIITKDDPTGSRFTKELTARALIDPKAFSYGFEQLSMFNQSPIALALPDAKALPKGEKVYQDLVSDAVEETVLCLTSRL
jgi:predicted DNA-binding helix-hairpin-helix protein